MSISIFWRLYSFGDFFLFSPKMGASLRFLTYTSAGQVLCIVRGLGQGRPANSSWPARPEGMRANPGPALSTLHKLLLLQKRYRSNGCLSIRNLKTNKRRARPARGGRVQKPRPGRAALAGGAAGPAASERERVQSAAGIHERGYKTKSVWRVGSHLNPGWQYNPPQPQRLPGLTMRTLAEP